MEGEVVSRWLEKTGPESDVVVSSRVRLARNLANYPFANQASFEDLNEISSEVTGLLKTDNKFKLKLISLADLAEADRKMLVERHLISPEHAWGGENSLVALSEDETISLMVNEEDHFRLQILLPGLQLEESWQLADQVDNYLESNFELAFDDEYGYLTACPTNVGTGLRASVMVHLPALEILNRVDSLMSAISKLGLAVRGLYGEGTETIGNLYQISNQVTLGSSEEEIIENLLEVTGQIINQERRARQTLLEERETELKDRVYRALGILKNAYTISIEEALDLISNVRLGLDLDIIDNIAPEVLTQLMIIIRPATLKRMNYKKDFAANEEIKRAEIIKQKLREG
jgi:protein arginine kinase